MSHKTVKPIKPHFHLHCFLYRPRKRYDPTGLETYHTTNASRFDIIASFFSQTLKERLFILPPFSDAAYLHHWLSATIHFNRYNLCFDKYKECVDKCKPLYFMVLHIRVVPPLLSSFVECPLSDSMYWMIGHFRRYVPERLLNAKVVVFLGFLWFTVDFYSLKGVGWWKIGHKTGYLLWNIYDSLEKMWGNRWIRWKKCNRSDLFTWKSVELYMW